MVDFRPRPGFERPVDGEGFGKSVALLAVEREGSSLTDGRGLPLHLLDVQVAMFDGANGHLRRQSETSLSGRPVAYSSEEMIAIVTAAWQQDDPADPATPAPTTTEQEVDGGTVYAFVADVAMDRKAGVVRALPGSIGRMDPALVPARVMEAQVLACERASAQAIVSREDSVEAGAAGRVRQEPSL